MRSTLQIASTFRQLNPNHQLSAFFSRRPPLLRFASSALPTPLISLSVRGFSSKKAQALVYKAPNKPPICTADELHYVPVHGSDWKLALWRYHPSPQAPQRNHPLLLLSGVGTNAIGYDLSPKSSFARHMSGHGFDTWILEVRGAGLSVEGSSSKEIEQSAHAISEQMEAAANSATSGVLPASQRSTEVVSDSMEPENIITKEDQPIGIPTVFDESKLVTMLTEVFMRLSEEVSDFLNEGQSKIIFTKLFDQMSKLFEESFLSEPFNETRWKLSSLLETNRNSAVASQIRELSQKLVNIMHDGQQSVSPSLFDLQKRLIRTVEDFQKQLELIVKYDWDFDHYLEEDVPAAMEYIKAQTNPKDGKLLAVGHSMGGILLYALLSRYAAEGSEPDLAAIVTLVSSLDYRSSKSSLKLLLPLADPAQVLNVPAVPLGALLTVTFPLSSRPPYVLSWLNHMISAEDMMHPELLKKLVLNNFCTIPTKLLLQLASAFREGGLCDRSGKFFYKNHLHKSNVPILAIAGDQDQICPTEAVYETVKLIPENLVTYKIFGEPGGPHYGHYDLVAGRHAASEFCLFYKDRNERWRTVGDIPWKEFIDCVKRLRIVQKDEVIV